MKNKLTILALIIYSTIHLKAQQLNSTPYTNIKNHDFSKLWHVNSMNKNSTMEDVTIAEPLGFIGEQFQRLYIHYTTVIKNKLNENQYNVTGKTKVKDNICRFSGTITIIKAGIYKAQLDNRFKEGFVECKIDFKEDSTQNSTGYFKGKLISKFYLDEKDKVQYNDLMFGADGYKNNQCEATWTSYTTHKSKQTNWGDYRIPNKGLDIGDGEFMPADKYIKNGWQNYKLAHSGNPDNEATKKAELIETEKWWL